jgi:hypothetical protein
MAVRYLTVGKDERCRGTEDQNSARWRRSSYFAKLYRSRQSVDAAFQHAQLWQQDTGTDGG